jgi:lipoprotein-anchoring transpeptidase ErfK/SrfK
MQGVKSLVIKVAVACGFSIFLTACATTQSNGYTNTASYDPSVYASRLPENISMGHEKVVLVDPRAHAWGAYDTDGKLVRAGIATAGGNVCPEGEPGSCRTATGTFRIHAMKGADCYSRTFPRPNGGGLMPYCMFFHEGQALRGSPDSIVVEDNVSHGCVRMRIPDAEWVQNSFAKMGTKVVVLPY